MAQINAPYLANKKYLFALCIHNLVMFYEFLWKIIKSNIKAKSKICDTENIQDQWIDRWIRKMDISFFRTFTLDENEMLKNVYILFMPSAHETNIPTLRNHIWCMPSYHIVRGYS